MEIEYTAKINVTNGVQRDDLYKGVCAHCGKPLYEGDTVYKSAFGTFCVECFFEYVVDDLFTVA